MTRLVPVLALGILAAACSSPTTAPRTTAPAPNPAAPRAAASTPGPSSATATSTVTPTTAAPPAPAAPVTLGAPNPSTCVGCGQVEPPQVRILTATSPGVVVPEVDFTGIRWQAWGTPTASASVTAYFTGPGETDQVTLTAFDLGPCGSTYGYRALEWTSSGQAFRPSDYFDTCTGRHVGQG